MPSSQEPTSGPDAEHETDEANATGGRKRAAMPAATCS